MSGIHLLFPRKSSSKRQRGQIRLLIERLEERTLLSSGHAMAGDRGDVPMADATLVAEFDSRAHIPGMVLRDESSGTFEGQIVYLDFNGETRVSYHGPVTVSNFNVLPFSVPSSFVPADRDDLVMDCSIKSGTHISQTAARCST